MAKKDWWRGAVMYQIYPRSFMDLNGDGIGDLPGITDRLEYVAELGVDGVWISPFFKSPMADFGYDVSDYRDVDPIFGVNEDFDLLLKKAHRLGLKIIIDMVLSHTSNKHPWFVESRTGRDNAKADWYVWADPKPDGSPPNNWQSCFGGSAWTFETHRGQYYLHNFLKEQPDLNFHNPQVRESLLAACRYWLERGVDGFRLDVVNFYFHDQELRDNPVRDTSGTTFALQFEKRDPYSMQAHVYDKSRPENLLFLKEFRALMDDFPGTFTLGEIGDDHPYERSVEYVTGERLNTCYNTHMMSGHREKALTADLIRGPSETFEKYNAEAWPTWAFCNHDVVRVIDRWGKGVPHDRQRNFAKMLMTLLCSLRGTVFIYQGEELGLPEADIPFEKIQDPWGKYLWPEWQGRDGCRTPMPWHAKEKHAGFSTGKETWLPIPESHVGLSVDRQKKDPDSILNFTKEFLAWRKTQETLVRGDIHFIDTGSDTLLAFTREKDGHKILCAFNLGQEPATLENAPAVKGGERGFPQKGKPTDGQVELPGFGYYFASVAG